MMDGARLGVALSTVDYTLNDLANLCDVFYIGGTKNGALIGEAVVISNPELKPYFLLCDETKWSYACQRMVAWNSIFRII